uniref:acyl-CoA dehydrogenase domain-containing protein n=1 Tax=Salmonella enterica TaxID=28901 RepID=UPI00398C309B
AGADSGGTSVIKVAGANRPRVGVMIFGQGAIGSQYYVLEERAEATNNGVNAFAELVFIQTGHVGRHTVRGLWLVLTRGLTRHTPTCAAQNHYYPHLNRLSANPALLSHVSHSLLHPSPTPPRHTSPALAHLLIYS